MPTEPTSPLATLAASLRTDYEVWYAKSVRRLGFTYLGLQLISLLAGFGAASIAALVSPAGYNQWARFALVVIPAIGSLASGIVLQFRLQDLWRLREEGRIAF